MKYLVSAIVAAALLLGVPSQARAQSEITLLAPNPIKETLDELVAAFEKKTGQALDVSLLFAPFPEALKTGNIDPKSATVIARLRLALAVKKGAPKPDISTAAAAK